MGKFLMKWKEKTLADKILTGIVMACSVLVIALALLQLLNIWRDAAFAYMPLMCVNMLAVAVSNWKTNRGAAVVNLAAAGIMLVCIALVVYFRLSAA